MLLLIPAQTEYQTAGYLSMVVSFYGKGKIETRLNVGCSMAMMLRRHYQSQDQKVKSTGLRKEYLE